MTAIPANVALVDDTGQIPAGELARLAGALNEQVLHDFARDWHTTASVTAYPADSVPSHAWAVRIQAKLDQPAALGYHTTSNNQPVAYVELTDTYPQTVSHELLEMLADPFGNRMHQAHAPDIDPVVLQQAGLTSADTVSYLLEVCDPCEQRSYHVAGVELSDYLLPRWYRTAPGSNAWFSHAGYCSRPRQVQNGGYVSFSTLDGHWWQVFNENGYQINDLGQFNAGDGARSLREWTDRAAADFRAASINLESRGPEHP